MLSDYTQCLSSNVQASTGDMQDEVRRLSARKRKPAQPQSPDEGLKPKKKKRSLTTPLTRVPRRDPTQPFKCDLCGSPYVINPSRRGNRPKTSTHQPSPRHKIDITTGATLTLCNACGAYSLLVAMMLFRSACGLILITVYLKIHVIPSFGSSLDTSFFLKIIVRNP